METALDKLAGCEFRISSFEFRQTKPNKPNADKAFAINSMSEKSAKQTQRAYPTCYQLLTAILAPIFRKFGWMGRGSLSGIRATPRGPALENTNAGLNPSATGPRRRNLPANLRCAVESAYLENDRPIRNSGGNLIESADYADFTDS
jgi:hypothetical protein